jgi:endo-1,3-1,4-beta-glycanase ExoK
MRFTANRAAQACLTAAALAACVALPGAAQQRRQAVSDAAVIQRFDKDDPARWWRADNRTGGKKMNDTGFSAGNILIDGGEMTLTLENRPYRDRGNTGASYKSQDLYHYGRFDAVMKAARGSGVVSAFYTYTGPVFGAPHDEIDFEFLGRDPRLLHLNYFVGGKAQLKRTVELDFDASEDFHLYTIEWRPGEIVWFVDGNELFRVAGDPADMPSHPGKLITEIWAAKGLKKWAGVLDPEALPSEAHVRCMSWRPFGSDAPRCALGDSEGAQP